jgi:WXG100 family type VII secretion target
MSRFIMVEPQQLESAAGKIEQQAADYESTYRKLFNEVDAMSNAWQGADNVAFTNQIKTFTTDFEKMTQLMRDYAEFLRLSAKAYRDAQNEVKTQASRL